MRADTGEIATEDEIRTRPDREEFRPLPADISVSEMAVLQTMSKTERTMIISKPDYLAIWLLGLRCRPVAASHRRKAMRSIQETVDRQKLRREIQKKISENK